MNDTIENPTTATPAAATKKAPAKTAPKKAGPAKAAPEKVENAAEKAAYTATGRSGQPSTRVSATAITHAVDVQRDGRANYQAGVICKFFASKEAAEKFAAEVNSGEMGKRNDWYETARDAIVVEAIVVEESAK